MSDRPSFGGFLRALKDSFPSTLVGGAALERLFCMAEQLPICVIDHQFGFEFDLANEQLGADFCVVVPPGSALSTHYMREGESASAGTPRAALGDCLAKALNDPASLLARNGGDLILEYDVVNTLSVEPSTPGVFFAASDADPATARRLLDCPRDVIAELWNVAAWHADLNEARQIERVYEALPEGAVVGQAGVLPGRAERAVRLVIHSVEHAALPNVLEELAWPGSNESVMSVLAHTSDFTRPLAVLSLDVAAAGISPRLGMELFVPGKEKGRGRWLPLIDRLQERQWCLPAKAEGLRAWAGTQRAIGEGAIFQAHRSINHVKAVVLHEQVTAKAYAAVGVRRIDS